MYDLTLVAIVLGGFHFAVAFIAVEVLNLSYPQYLTMIGVVGVLSAVLVKATMFTWKDRIAAVVRGEEKDGQLLTDAMGFFAVLIASGIASIYIVRRKYGWEGYAGAIGVNMLVNAVV